MSNKSTVHLLPITRNSGEGMWVREPGWVSPAGTVHVPSPAQLQARIAELETGLRDLQEMLFHTYYCARPEVLGAACSCTRQEQAALITSLLESR